MTPTRINYIFLAFALGVNLFCQELRVQLNQPTLEIESSLANVAKFSANSSPSTASKKRPWREFCRDSHSLEMTPSLNHANERAETIGLKVFDMHGSRLDNVSWARFHTIMRFFSYQIQNQSGSLEDLVVLAIQENPFARAERKGRGRSRKFLRAAYSDDSFAGYPVLEVQFNRKRLEWFPAHEFIATVPARRPGRILVDFLIVSRWRPAKPVRKMTNVAEVTELTEVEEDAVAHKSILRKDTGIGRNESCSWEFGYAKKKILFAYPGQEAEVMSHEASLLFEEWAMHINQLVI